MGTQNFNVRSDNPDLSASDQFDKDADLRKSLILKRKETEIQIDTYNTRLVNSVTNMVQTHFVGQFFNCSIFVYDKHTVISLKVDSANSLSSEIPFNIMHVKSSRIKTDILTRLQFLLDLSLKYKDNDGSTMNCLHRNDDKDLKPSVSIKLETRTKYF